MRWLGCNQAVKTRPHRPNHPHYYSTAIPITLSPSDAVGQGNGITPAMLSIDQLKNIDPELRDLTDAELVDIRSKLYALAELALDCWSDHVLETMPAPTGLNDDPENNGRGKLSA